MRYPRTFSISLSLLLFVSLQVGIRADDLWLADASEQPGVLRLSEGGTSPHVAFARQPIPDRAYPEAIMKVSQIAVGADGRVYYCSGLDGSLMHLLDGRHEIQSLEVDGQIRDIACTGEEHTVYYSVVATPQDGQALGDGHIYRRDFWSGTPELVATVRQADVGYAWWGCFTIREGTIYLVTLGSPSRIFAWDHGQIQPVFHGNTHKIAGISASPDGGFLFVDGAGTVRETENFEDVHAVLSTKHHLSDVSVRASSHNERPRRSDRNLLEQRSE
jgi:hypothetical protein